jgi:hypothetical protein
LNLTPLRYIKWLNSSSSLKIATVLKGWGSELTPLVFEMQ